MIRAVNPGQIFSVRSDSPEEQKKYGVLLNRNNLVAVCSESFIGEERLETIRELLGGKKELIQLVAKRSRIFGLAKFIEAKPAQNLWNGFEMEENKFNYWFEGVRKLDKKEMWKTEIYGDMWVSSKKTEAKLLPKPNEVKTEQLIIPGLLSL